MNQLIEDNDPVSPTTDVNDDEVDYANDIGIRSYNNNNNNDLEHKMLNIKPFQNRNDDL